MISSRTFWTATLNSVPLGHQRLELGGDVVQRLGQDGVDRHHRAGDGLQRPRGPELEAVAGEGERAGPVAVARVGRQHRQRVDPDLQGALLLGARGAALGDLVEDVGQLVAQEDRDDGRRGLVGAEPVVVARRGHRRPQQAAVLVDGADDGGAEHQELGVGVRRVSRQEQVALGGVAQREVDVLARAVDALERLLVEQALHAVLLGDALQGRPSAAAGGRRPRWTARTSGPARTGRGPPRCAGSWPGCRA